MNWHIVLFGPACPLCGFWCQKRCLRPTFKVDFRKDPLSPEIFTSAFLIIFLSTLRVAGFGAVHNCTYGDIHNQR